MNCRLFVSLLFFIYRFIVFDCDVHLRLQIKAGFLCVLDYNRI